MYTSKNSCLIERTKEQNKPMIDQWLHFFEAIELADLNSVYSSHEVNVLELILFDSNKLTSHIGKTNFSRSW